MYDEISILDCDLGYPLYALIVHVVAAQHITLGELHGNKQRHFIHKRRMIKTHIHLMRRIMFHTGNLGKHKYSKEMSK